ncbi:hypothetical protein K502DRAFT_325364 [Neoconidiobolus thromboides FSU 785]|nr:hypothetical protein K502DRAFT_325364 [Neoconidiobolus thromboides FSU 785]
MPRDILFLIGAPGSGKGTVTPHIIEAQRSTNTPICMSSLLKSPAMKELIDQGIMIDDATVLEHLIFACMERDQSVPLIVDGFPRTQIQVDCLVHLSNKLKQLNQSSLNTGLTQRFPLPSFKVAILYISKQTSLVRQMQRGMQAKLHNQKVLESGKGSLIEERCTDLSEQLVLTRYKAFEQNMGSVTCLMKHFPFHMINADCQLQEVITNLLEIFNSSYPQPESSQLNPIQSKNAKPIWHGFKNSNHSALESFFI